MVLVRPWCQKDVTEFHVIYCGLLNQFYREFNSEMFDFCPIFFPEIYVVCDTSPVNVD